MLGQTAHMRRHIAELSASAFFASSTRALGGRRLPSVVDQVPAACSSVGEGRGAAFFWRMVRSLPGSMQCNTSSLLGPVGGLESPRQVTPWHLTLLSYLPIFIVPPDDTANFVDQGRSAGVRGISVRRPDRHHACTDRRRRRRQSGISPKPMKGFGSGGVRNRA